MTIKHLVFTGGGTTAILKCLSAYQFLETQKFVSTDQIESIYGTSAGCIVGILICLKYNWDHVNSYIIDRPWNELFRIKIQQIFELYNKKGIYDINIIEKIFKPLFDVQDVSLDITLEDFYKFAKIELHFSTFEINSFKLIDVSYLTHPKLKLLQALQMTCGLPIIVVPVCIENGIYIDGGFKNAYSINTCLDSGKKSDEILGFKNNYTNTPIEIKKETNFIDFIFSFMFKIIKSVAVYEDNKIEHELEFDSPFIDISILKETTEKKELRIALFEEGKNVAEKFLLDKNMQSLT
jgi:predicted acylesterase/phospholipase RssA